MRQRFHVSHVCGTIAWIIAGTELAAVGACLFLQRIGQLPAAFDHLINPIFRTGCLIGLPFVAMQMFIDGYQAKHEFTSPE